MFTVGQSDDKEDVDKTVFKLPKKYDKRYKINISLRYPPRELLDRYGDTDDEGRFSPQ